MGGEATEEQIGSFPSAHWKCDKSWIYGMLGHWLQSNKHLMMTAAAVRKATRLMPEEETTVGLAPTPGVNVEDMDGVSGCCEWVFPGRRGMTA